MCHFPKEQIISSETNESLLYVVLHFFQLWKFWQTNLLKFISMISIILKGNFYYDIKVYTKIPKIAIIIFNVTLKVKENMLLPFR